MNLAVPWVIVTFSISGKVFNICRYNHGSAGNAIIQWLKGHRGANTAGASRDIPDATGEGANNPLSTVSNNNCGIIYRLLIYLFSEVDA